MNISQTAPSPIYLKDYRPPPYLVDDIFLYISLDRDRTLVRSRLSVRPNPILSGEALDKDRPSFWLDGEDITLHSVHLNGTLLSESDYRLCAHGLFILSPPENRFILETESECAPSRNRRLSGLYLSEDLYCTQCEAEGFRRITFFPDRPDIMSRYRVHLEGDIDRCPVLLSNGNLESSGISEDSGRHYAIWHDPFAKPCYLFALIAGSLGYIEDIFRTRSGRDVILRVYASEGDEDKCHWAMESLKRSMGWDEDVFGREYDLDIFMIVAVSDFNSGAMENKGLNIFNARYILASPESATDRDYESIEGIIAHEYFHNWTGNRITCRDWFQLCLKEGLTVFRDQEFTSDMRDRSVKRISDVIFLREHQIPEDMGPLSHAPRPSSYIEINNFYTSTVYEKGAEIYRMLRHFVGSEIFHSAMDLFFTRCDGSAVTVEDFIFCMESVSGRDLGLFFNWFTLSGIPHLDIEESYDGANKRYSLMIKQSPPLNGRDGDGDRDGDCLYHIPLLGGFLDESGNVLPLCEKNCPEGVDLVDTQSGTFLLEIKEKHRVFNFDCIDRRPVLSLNRHFTAPIMMAQRDIADRLFLLSHDIDDFNRWDSCQSLLSDYMISQAGFGSGDKIDFAPLAEALGKAVASCLSSPAYASQLLIFPSVNACLTRIGSNGDPISLWHARRSLMEDIGRTLYPLLERIYEEFTDLEAYAPSAEQIGRRCLRYRALSLLCYADCDGKRAYERYISSPHMTGKISALEILSVLSGSYRDRALSDFHDKYGRNPLLIDKWFSLSLALSDGCAVSRAEDLLHHPAFRFSNPNRVRSIFMGLVSNIPEFHSELGYDFLVNMIDRLDGDNPQLSARLASIFKIWRLLDKRYGALIRDRLILLHSRSDISRGLYEILDKSLDF